MEGLFHEIFINSMQATIVGVIILSFKKLMGNRLSPLWHYVIWSILIIKLLIPIGPQSKISIFNAIPEEKQILRSIQHREDKEVKKSIDKKNTDSEHEKMNLIETPIGRNEVGNIQGMGQIERLEQTKGLEQVKKLQHMQNNTLESIAAYIWLLGVVLISIVIWGTKIIFYKKLKSLKSIKSERLEQLLAECKEKMGITREIDFIIQDKIAGPAFLGIMRPSIILTKEILKLDNREIEYILLHELAHYKRHDLWVNTVLIVLQSLHWFNPIIGYLFKSIREDIEVATDITVLNCVDPSRHQDYGKTLINLAEETCVKNSHISVMGMSNNKKILTKRIKTIKIATWFQKKRRLFTGIGITCLVVLGGILLTDRVAYRDVEQKAWEDRAKEMWQYRTPYLGDASKVVGLLDQLNYREARLDVALQTKQEPYGITVNYDANGCNVLEEKMRPLFYNNAAMMFALINNVDILEFKIIDPSGIKEPYVYRYTRKDMEETFEKSLREYGKSPKTLVSLEQELSRRIRLE